MFILTHILLDKFEQYLSLIFISLAKQSLSLQDNNLLIIIYKYKIKNLLKTLISEWNNYHYKLVFKYQV